MSASKDLNPAPKKNNPQSKTLFKPPFDLFGIHPSFYLTGENRTVTWVGFFATLILISLMLWAIVVHTVSFFKKD
jgi:hypothetical protein